MIARIKLPAFTHLSFPGVGAEEWNIEGAQPRPATPRQRLRTATSLTCYTCASQSGLSMTLQKFGLSLTLTLGRLTCTLSTVWRCPLGKFTLKLWCPNLLVKKQKQKGLAGCSEVPSDRWGSHSSEDLSSTPACSPRTCAPVRQGDPSLPHVQSELHTSPCLSEGPAL